MNDELEKLKIGISGLKKLYEKNAKRMSANDIIGFDLTFVNLNKALIKYEKIKTILDTWNTSGTMSDSEALQQIDEVLKNE